MTLLKVLTENQLHETIPRITLALLFTIAMISICYIVIRYKDAEEPLQMITVSVILFLFFGWCVVKEVQTYGQLNTMYQSDKISDYYKITHDGNALHFKQSHGPDLEETDFYTPIISENNKTYKIIYDKKPYQIDKNQISK